ncbi:MAG TPA: hypothetical protein VMT12_07865 [Syntrophales bacterium]|nr:hypothetical protein [Syntrophales bacterium]
MFERLIMFKAIFVFTLITTAITAGELSSAPVNEKTAKQATAKEPRQTQVTFVGIVKAISTTMLVVERTIKGKVETLEFALDKSIENIRVGDRVKISHIKKDGKHIAMRVTLFIDKRIIKTPETKAAKQDAH